MLDDFLSTVIVWESDVKIIVPSLAVYIEICEKDFDGFFVHFEYDTNRKAEELRFLFLKNDGSTMPISLHLIPGGTIQDGVLESIALSIKNSQRAGNPHALMLNNAYDLVYQSTVKSLQFVLYVCAGNADLEQNQEQMKIYHPGAEIRDKLREVQLIDAGTHLHLLSPEDSVINRHESLSSGKTHASPRPHMRRGHWHHFWAGKGKKELILHWIAPTYVK